MSDFSLSKRERLNSRKSIGELFDRGNSFFIFPLKVVYGFVDSADGQPVKAAFSVSKRNFKRAIKRNYLKRLMREAYRLNKKSLVDAFVADSPKLAVMFIYAVKDEKDYSTVEKSMRKSLAKLRSLLDAGFPPES